MSNSTSLATTTRRGAALVGALVIAALAVLVGASTALAHAELSSSFPRNQEVLDVAPTAVVLEFTEGVDPIEPGIRVIGADGEDVGIGDVDQSAGSDEMRAVIPATLDEGSYVVAWQALSADSHRVRGSFTFSVGAPSAVTPGVIDGVFDTSSSGASDGVMIGIGRFLSYAGIGLLVGGLVLAIALTPSVIGSRRIGVLLVGAGVLGFVGTVWMIAAQANLIGGSILAWGTVADTRSGQWWIARLVAIVLFGALIVARAKLVTRGGVVVVSALGIGVLAVTAAGGHAISGDAVVLGFFATLVHLAAMSIWFGGLALVLLAPPAAQFWTRITTFSPWALGSVAALAVTGGLNAWRQLGSLADVTESTYGRWLVIKLVLVVLVLGLAAFGRRTIHTRGDEASAVLLRRSIGLEVAGIVLILGATAGLVNSPPPTDSPEVVSVSSVVGDRVVQVELEPAVTGGTEMHVYVTSPSGALDRADEISVRAGLPAQNIAPFDVEVFPAGVNHVVGSNLDLPVAGLWTFDVSARYGEFDEVVFTVQIPVSS